MHPSARFEAARVVGSGVVFAVYLAVFVLLAAAVSLVVAVAQLVWAVRPNMRRVSARVDDELASRRRDRAHQGSGEASRSKPNPITSGLSRTWN